jgi:hypothetical protein
MWLGIVYYPYVAKNWCLVRCTMYCAPVDRLTRGHSDRDTGQNNAQNAKAVGGGDLRDHAQGAQ